MMEQRLKRVDDDIKALKANLPISGSLVKTYCHNATSSKTFPDGTAFTYTVKFTPSNEGGIVDLSGYIELWTNSPTFSQYNPVALYFNSGYTINSSGEYIATGSGSFSASDGSTFEVRATAVVYGTLDGSIEINFS